MISILNSNNNKIIREMVHNINTTTINVMIKQKSQTMHILVHSHSVPNEHTHSSPSFLMQSLSQRL